MMTVALKYVYFAHFLDFTKQQSVKEGSIITVDEFYIEVLKYIVQYAPELPDMIQKGLKYLSKEFSNVVGNRIDNSSHSTNSLQEYVDSNNVNNEDIRKDYRRISFAPKHKLHFYLSKQ